jgi:hypothetical protein
MFDDIEDTAELELIRTAEMEQLDDGDRLQIEGEDDDAGFDPYNRV